MHPDFAKGDANRSEEQHAENDEHGAEDIGAHGPRSAANERPDIDSSKMYFAVAEPALGDNCTAGESEGRNKGGQDPKDRRQQSVLKSR